MKEIGGYFELETLVSNCYYKNLLALNTSRNALIYLLKIKKINKIYLPIYLCDVIYNTLEKYNYKYEFYHINEKLLPAFDKKLDYNEYIYIVNYYGILDNKNIFELKRKYHNIIIDNTHSFFQEPIDGIDTIYNCRKWFGVPDGAYLSTNTFLDKSIDVDFSKDRMGHLLGRYEGSAYDYYDYFKETDRKFQYEPIKKMSRLTKNLMGAIDYDRVISSRKKNYDILEFALGKINRLKIIKPLVPFCYPLWIKHANEMRDFLIEHKVYVPTLWPNVIAPSLKGTLEYDMAENILPLPCDQRYDEYDMEYIIKVIKKEVCL